MIKSRVITSAIMLTLLVGCSASQDISRAEDGIKTFRKRMDMQQYEAIIDQADPKMLENTNREQAIKFLESVQTKLGSPKSMTRVNWNDNIGTYGHLMTLVENTNFANASATENFVFEVSSEEPKLVGYHINVSVNSMDSLKL